MSNAVTYKVTDVVAGLITLIIYYMKHLKRKLCLIMGGGFLCFNTWAQSPTDSVRVEAEEAWYIHFKPGKSDLEQDYSGNSVTLQRFTERVRDIVEKKEFSIIQIRITGYASPEGPVELNRRLSEERAQVLKSYLVQATRLPENLFQTLAGGENWNELCIMLENSRLAWKDRALDIIRNSPEGSDPEPLLKRLPGGAYRYMLHNFYPTLRSTSSVQLLREIPVEKAALPVVIEEEIKEKETLAVTDTPRYVPEPQPEPCRCDPPFLGVKTNLAYWAACIIPNIELETYFARRFSFSAEGVYRWIKDRKAKGNTYNLAYASPEARMYLRDDATYRGHYFGLYGQYGEYDLKTGHTGRQGNFRGLGLSYGYIFKFHRFDCLYFDLGLSAGYGRMNYDAYYWYDPCNAFKSHVGRNYWGPTKMKASIMWRF